MNLIQPQRPVAAGRGRRTCRQQSDPGIVVIGRGELGLALAASNPRAVVYIFEHTWSEVDRTRTAALERNLLSRVRIRHVDAMPVVSRYVPA